MGLVSGGTQPRHPRSPAVPTAEASKLVMSYVAAVSSKGEEVDKVKEQLLQSNPVLEGEWIHVRTPSPSRGSAQPPCNPMRPSQPLETPRPSAMTTLHDS